MGDQAEGFSQASNEHSSMVPCKSPPLPRWEMGEKRGWCQEAMVRSLGRGRGALRVVLCESAEGRVGRGRLSLLLTSCSELIY